METKGLSHLGTARPGIPVCAVVVTYNIGRLAGRCIASIREQVGEVVIVDNGSGHGTQEELDKLALLSRVKIIRNSRNEGIARAMNQGIRRAIAHGYEWVLTLDHDSEATPGMVARLLRAYADLPGSEAAQLGILGANPFDRNGKFFIYGVDPGSATDPLEVTNLVSSGSLIRSRVFKTVGFFDEGLFIYYVDDDFCIRVRRAGLKILLCSEAVLLHSEGLRIAKKLFGSRRQYVSYGKEAHYFLCRNGIHMLRRYRGARSLCHHIRGRIGWDFLRVLIYDQQKAQKVFYRLRGLWDGARGRYGPL